MRSERSHFIARVFAACIATVVSAGAGHAQTDPQKQTRIQPSPQGQTGPLNTGAGGAPPETPQGETPPNMQATSPGAKDAPKGK
jgi:hypothetical protein